MKLTRSDVDLLTGGVFPGFGREYVVPDLNDIPIRERLRRRLFKKGPSPKSRRRNWSVAE